MRYRIHGLFWGSSYIKVINMPSEPSMNFFIDKLAPLYSVGVLSKTLMSSRVSSTYYTTDKYNLLMLHVITKNNAIQRIGSFMPEAHPLFNFFTIQEKHHVLNNTSVLNQNIRQGNFKYLLDTINRLSNNTGTYIAHDYI